MADVAFIAADGAPDSERIPWARAADVVLEKWGVLGVERMPPQRLADEATWREHAVVLVADAPPQAWSPPALDLLEHGPAAALLEGPLSDPLLTRLGIAATPLAPEGDVVVCDDGLRAVATRLGVAAGGRLRSPTTRPVDRARTLDWQRLGAPPGEAVAARWRRLGWSAQRLVAPDATALADWIAADGTRSPAVVGRARIVACSFGLLAYLAQLHSAEPCSGPEHRSWAPGTGLETLLLGLLERLHVEAGRAFARVLPWPDPDGWALTVRHDVDRPMTWRAARRVLRGHDLVGTAATWYWRARHLSSHRGRVVLRMVRDAPRHEVALHTEQLWTTDAERANVEAIVGTSVLGTSAHGDPRCFRWQGAPNVLWAERHGLRYTELIAQAHLHPHRFVAVQADGSVRASDVICLPHHESFDRSSCGGDPNVARIREAAGRFAAAGGCMQVLNHPDINVDALFATLGELPTAGRLDWTAAEIATWWRRTHALDRITLTVGPTGTLDVRAVEPMRLAVEIRDGSRPRTVAVHA